MQPTSLMQPTGSTGQHTAKSQHTHLHYLVGSIDLPDPWNKTMNLPRQWSVLSFENTDKSFSFGAHFSSLDSDQQAPQPCHYSIFLTDYYHTWLCDVNEIKIRSQAKDRGYDASGIRELYSFLTENLQASFTLSGTTLQLEQGKYDQGVPLELKIKMSKTLPGTTQPFTWEFEMIRLPDSSTNSIFRNLNYYNITVIYSLFDYIGALKKELEGRDNIIRISKENMNDQNRKIIENGSNRRFANQFDQLKFDAEWSAKSLASFQGKDIWDEFLPGINARNFQTFGSTFVDKNVTNALRRKRSQNDSGMESDSSRMIGSPTKKTRLNIEKLSGNLKNDLNLSPERNESVSTSNTLETESSSSKSPSGTPSPKREKKQRVSAFGVSQKRKACQTKYSPIKAPRL